MSDLSADERPRGPGRPRVTETPEFTEAVDAAVKAQMRELLPELLAQLGKARSSEGDAGKGDQHFAQALALQLAELTGQGQGRVYVAPEIIDHRRRATQRLTEALIATRARGELPAYRLVNKVFLNMGPRMGEMVIDPLYRDNDKIVRPVEIDWPGIPNLAMQPLNAAAEQIFAIYCETIGHQGAAAAPDELLALTSHGAVVRGGAAKVILQNDRNGSNEVGEPGRPEAGDLPAAGIRRRDAAPVQKIQVLGSLTRPVEVS